MTLPIWKSSGSGVRVLILGSIVTRGCRRRWQSGAGCYHQGMNRMIALDAFNGAVLWSLEIPDLRRVNIPRDSANWCADESHVFAAVRIGCG